MEEKNEKLSIYSIPTNMVEVMDFVKRTEEIVDSGDVDPLKVQVRLKLLEKILKLIDKRRKIKTLALEEAEKHGERVFNLYGAEIQIKEAGVKYDYSVCTDSKLEKLMQDKELLDCDIKARQNYLKKLSGETHIGEGELIRPPVKKSTTTVQITIK